MSALVRRRKKYHPERELNVFEKSMEARRYTSGAIWCSEVKGKKRPNKNRWWLKPEIVAIVKRIEEEMNAQ